MFSTITINFAILIIRHSLLGALMNALNGKEPSRTNEVRAVHIRSPLMFYTQDPDEIKKGTAICISTTLQIDIL